MTTTPFRTSLLVVLATLGLAVPWYFTLTYLGSGGSLAPAPFLSAVTANALTTSITWDVYLAAACFCLWLHHDAKAIGIRRAWVYSVLVFAVGLAFAMPLYFLLRTRATGRTKRRGDASPRGVAGDEPSSHPGGEI